MDQEIKFFRKDDNGNELMVCANKRHFTFGGPSLVLLSSPEGIACDNACGWLKPHKVEDLFLDNDREKGVPKHVLARVGVLAPVPEGVVLHRNGGWGEMKNWGDHGSRYQDVSWYTAGQLVPPCFINELKRLQNGEQFEQRGIIYTDGLDGDTNESPNTTVFVVKDGTVLKQTETGLEEARYDHAPSPLIDRGPTPIRMRFTGKESLEVCAGGSHAHLTLTTADGATTWKRDPSRSACDKRCESTVPWNAYLEAKKFADGQKIKLPYFGRASASEAFMLNLGPEFSDLLAEFGLMRRVPDGTTIACFFGKQKGNSEETVRHRAYGPGELIPVEWDPETIVAKDDGYERPKRGVKYVLRPGDGFLLAIELGNGAGKCRVEWWEVDPTGKLCLLEGYTRRESRSWGGGRMHPISTWDEPRLEYSVLGMMPWNGWKETRGDEVPIWIRPAKVSPSP